ncbi:phosphocarrier protein HPr [Caloranaerobacter azorensis H53214]|uniref:Phosphocarrier protein HPr n=1 Tax=Caloranaerobacter azorensis H53214 TaxID=1156417 RepID=A0A096BIF6_9FIRM|nr:HPr family phosphocarrier protein [Caloranaerobacter azorensis]KGG80642.1 phosphocarrier protein HPr [Caloranaerobacter azorensis H53214]
MYTAEVELKNETGLHARPASIFVKEASKYTSDIKIIKNGKEYNAKSIMGILSLGAGKGDKLTITAEGEDEKQAIQALKALVENNFEK